MHRDEERERDLLALPEEVALQGREGGSATGEGSPNRVPSSPQAEGGMSYP